jgi:signal transduction histidine kinase
MREPLGGEAVPGAPARADAAGEVLERLLSVAAEEDQLRRLLGALADAVPEVDVALLAADVAALGGEEGARLEIVAAVGIELPPHADAGPLAARALETGAPARHDGEPGRPFPEGTRAALAAPASAGATRAVLLAGARAAPALGPVAALAARLVADRAALALERGRLERARGGAEEAARRARAEVDARRKAVDFILGVVGHDLRNPLGAVHMSAALLHTRGGLGGWQARAVERLRSSAGRMGRIIADLLSYTRTRLGHGLPVTPRPASLEPLVRKVVDELAAVNPGRGIEIAVEGDVSGEWDPDRLEQVASNLISNAVDHGDPSAPVRVSLRAEGPGVVLAVSNSGPGIPPEVLEHLFEPFSRGPEATSRKSSGLGLGLYIAREIVRAHGGEVTATTGPETTVSVRLPRAVPAEPPGGPPA